MQNANMGIELPLLYTKLTGSEHVGAASYPDYTLPPTTQGAGQQGMYYPEYYPAQLYGSGAIELDHMCVPAMETIGEYIQYP